MAPSLRRAWGLVAAIAVAQAVLAGAVGLGDDEALYWTWAQDLGAVTVDHPPLVALLVAGGTRLLGDTPQGVRLPFLACGLLTSAVMGAWAGRIAGSRAAAVAVVGVAVAPLFAIGHVFAAPDMPVWLATACAGLALDHALGGGGARAWAAAGVAVGVGMWAKLTMGLLPLGVLAALLLCRPLRPTLRTPGPWIAAAIALVVWGPWLVQQAGAGWPTVRFHLLERHGRPPGIGGLLAGAAGQLGYLSPILAGALLAGLLRSGRAGPRRGAMLVALGAPPLLVFTLAGAATRALPHWGGAGWLVALVPGAALLAARPRLCAGALGLAGALSVAVHLQALWPVLPLGRADPTHDLVGWSALGVGLADLAGRADAGGCLPRLRGTRYQTASQAAFALGPGGPPVGALARPLGREAVAEEDPPDRCGDTLVVASDRYPLSRDCPAVLRVPVVRAGRVVRELRVHRCR